MATEIESHGEPMWKIERIAQEYEFALKQGNSRESIESLLAANLDLPPADLLRALIETELDVIGLGNDTIADYCSRFPVYAKLIKSIVKVPLDEVRPPVVEGLQIANYRIARLLGKGGLGYVYAAVDLHQQSPVAIKILRPDRLHAKDGFYRELFRNQALIGSALNHPRIVKLLASGEYNDLPFHVFEFVDGDTLRSFRGKRKLTPLIAAKLIAQVADTIHYSHQRGVVHRDLKPSNIIVDRNGRPRITDFGIALEDSQQGSGARIAGTPQYMSPEQLSGDADLVDGRSDIYSLGVILYEAAYCAITKKLHHLASVCRVLQSTL